MEINIMVSSDSGITGSEAKIATPQLENVKVDLIQRGVHISEVLTEIGVISCTIPPGFSLEELRHIEGVSSVEISQPVNAL
ncbi:MAG: hypothetical protein ACK481_03235 [Candidatus Melainabacteria bacterium]|jgi:hypothetical protein